MAAARALNRLNGTAEFTAWNIDELPAADLELIGAWMDAQPEPAQEETNGRVAKGRNR